MILDIFLALDLIGLGMLLGGGVYESTVINPNYRADMPRSLEQLRKFFVVKTPANYFRILSPATILSLLLTIIFSWNFALVRWWIISSFALLIFADVITYGFHYPRNKILFIDNLISDVDRLKKIASEWQIGNVVRIFFLLLAILILIRGIFIMTC